MSKFFRMDASRINPAAQQRKFTTILQRHEVPESEKVAEILFVPLHQYCSGKRDDLTCPFPLVVSLQSAKNHAARILEEVKGISDEFTLGKCQQILADFYGFRAWQAFTNHLEESFLRPMAAIAARRGKSIFPQFIVGSRAVQKSQSLFIYVDEAQDFLGHRDRYIEALRGIDGVPNVSFLIDGQKVFVFDKLIDLVEGLGDFPVKELDHDVIRDLVPLATIPAIEAVEHWGVAPRPYEVAKESGEYGIRHKSFNAWIPGAFDTEQEAKRIMARLLLGEIVVGEGDVVYRGQPLVMKQKLDINGLPARPHLEVEELEDGYVGYCYLSSATYVDGYAPLTKDLFEQVKELESRWKKDTARAKKHIQTNADTVWSYCPSIDLGVLNNSMDTVEDYQIDDLRELRQAYSEMKALSDGSLYELYDDYQRDARFSRGWSGAYRDVGFLNFLLGKILELDGESAEQTGEMVSFVLQQGRAIDEAFNFGRECYRYHTALRKMANRIAEVLSFLEKDKENSCVIGDPVTTFSDLLDMCQPRQRKFHTITQSIDDLPANVAEQLKIGWKE